MLLPSGCARSITGGIGRNRCASSRTSSGKTGNRWCFRHSSTQPRSTTGISRGCTSCLHLARTGFATSRAKRSKAFLNGKLKGGLSWKTVYHLRNALGAVLGSAEEWGYIQENPVRKTKLARREPKEEQAVLAPEQLRKLILKLREPASSLVSLLVVSGLRIGELLALRWRNVDLQGMFIRVKETVYEGHFDSPKTKRSVRAIPIGEEMAETPGRLQLRVSNSEVLVFATRDGKPLNRRNLLRRHLQPACKTLGLPRISWHSLRHANATLLDAVGAPLGTVQAPRGHTDAEVYLHAIPVDQRRAVENVERLVFGPKWTQVPEGREKGRVVIN